MTIDGGASPFRAASPTGPLEPGSEALRALFPPAAAKAYVDSASYGRPPMSTLTALERALAAWGDGSADWITDWDPAGEEARALAAGPLGAPATELALLPAVSVGVGLVAANLGPDDLVVVPDDEFRSVLFPLLAAQERLGTRVRRVPFDRVPDAVDRETTLVATSYVRSNDGRTQDLEALADAARSSGCRVLLDTTHAAGILPVDAAGLGFDFVVAAAYKHLLCPRGVAFMRIAPPHWPRLAPFTSSWRSTAAPYATYYGGTLADLVPTAARFDVSLAWHPWLGARESLRLLDAVGAEARRSWCVGLADRLATRLGLTATGSSILSVPVRVGREEAQRRLAEASIVASFPAGAVRVSFHLYNTEEECDYVAEQLARLGAG